MGVILDTSFVVTIERESHRGVRGPAHVFLATHPNEQYYITFTVAGELACGRTVTDYRDWQKLCRPFPALPWTAEIAWRYGELYRGLQSKGTLIGVNDLWIAATALVNGMDLVTGNVDEFSRVVGLNVIPFHRN